MINENNYVDKAEEAIIKLRSKVNKKTGKTEQMVTTTKIRNLLSMTSDIYNEVLPLQNDKLSDELVGKIEYLRIRFVYEMGREPKVRDFAEQADILQIIKEIHGSRKKYILFSRYMEALVAFHKFYGGKD